MKKIVCVLSLTAGAMIWSAALADDPAPANAPAQATATATTASAANDPNRIVCHQMVDDGMLIPRQKCMKQRDWNMVRQTVTRRAVEDMQRQAYQHGQ